MTDPPVSSRNLSRGRKLVYSALTLVIVLGSLHAVTEFAARRLLIRSIDVEDLAVFVVEPLVREQNGQLETTAYAELNSPKGSAPQPGGGTWTAIALGGSFLFGDPYGEPGQPPQPGGIPFFLQEQLERTEQPARILNLAGLGDSSIRVREKAKALLRHDPDLLIVATGNNEFPLEPSAARVVLRRIALFRILSLIGQPDGGPPSDPEELHRSGPPYPLLRAQYRANLEDIVAEAGTHGVPVLLATLPNNLLHELVTEEGQWDPARSGCITGLAAAAAQPASPPARWLEEVVSAGGTANPDFLDPCLDQALGAWPNNATEALAGLSNCDAEPLALAGAALVLLGRPRDAVRPLELWTESQPWGVRPSLNSIVREIAAGEGHVHLADLQSAGLDFAAREQGTVPGPGTFVDACHMHWTGYARAAHEILRKLDEEGLGAGAARRTLDLEDIAQRHKLPPQPNPLPPPVAEGEQGWTCPGSIPAP